MGASRVEGVELAVSEMDVGKNVNTMVCEKRYDGVACKLVGVSTVLCGAPGSLADAPTVRDLLETSRSFTVSPHDSLLLTHRSWSSDECNHTQDATDPLRTAAR